jgi:hypothetical protein
MTKKDYIRAAEIVRTEYAFNPAAHQTVVSAFISLFNGDNPNFDRDRFVAACKPKVKKA